MPNPLLRIEYPALPPREFSPNSRCHWRKKHAAGITAQNHVMCLLLVAGWNSGRSVKQGRVVFRFGLPDKRRRDLDNLIAASKPLLDALPLADDNVRQVRLEYDWFDSPGDAKTIIEVYEV